MKFLLKYRIYQFFIHFKILWYTFTFAQVLKQIVVAKGFKKLWFKYIVN